MNTLIDTKIKEWEENLRIGKDGSIEQRGELRVNGGEPVEEWRKPYLSDLIEYLRSSLQDIEKQTREEEAKAYAKGLAVICEKYPSLATEIKAILYDELKEKK